MALPGVLTKLRDVSAQLSGAEGRACDYIVKNPIFVVQNSLQVVSSESNVSEATIIRLCRKVDLSGYQELRLALAQAQAPGPIAAIHEDVALDDSPHAVLSKVFHSFRNALTDTLDVIDDEQLTTALDAIVSARSLSFFGLGASGAAAEAAYFRFLHLGTPCTVLTDSSGQFSRIATVGPDDAVILISHSGRSAGMVAAANHGRQRGATCIAITQYGRNPLANACHAVLHTSSVETAYRSEAMASRVAQQALLDALFVAASLSRHDEVVEAIAQSYELNAHLNR